MLNVAAQYRIGTRDFDFRLRSAARFTGIFGRSGAGKTTLLRLIAGLDRPRTGRIALGDTVLFDAGAESGRRIEMPARARAIGYIFQDGRLFPHLSVAGNLRYGARFATARPPIAQESDIIAVLGLGHLLDRRPATLSGGERQRVAIGRALLARPKILLLDEPLAALDPPRREEVLTYLEQILGRFPITMLYVSHHLPELLRLADQLAIVDDGRIAACDAPARLLADPRLAPLFGVFEAGAVLSLTILAHDPGHHLTTLALGPERLFVPLMAQPIGTPATLRIRARDVSLALTRPHDLSVLNILPARITAMTPLGAGQIDVGLDCAGHALIARITEQARERLALVPGMAAFALIKSVALHEESL